VSRALVALNLIFAAAAVAAGAYIARELTTPPPSAPVRARAPEPAPAAAPTTETPPPRTGLAAGSVVVSRNLFSPTRSEAPPSATSTRPAVQLPKPLLHGVVVREGAPIAYLEDPTTKRVAGYRLGDAIAGGTVQAINADAVVLARPDGSVDLRLRDPAKPRPAQAPQAGAPAGQQPPPGQPGVTVPPQAGLPQPGVQAPPITSPVVPGRRPLPPNLLRRLTPSQAPDAPQQ
jgi:hypothetical protein